MTGDAAAGTSGAAALPAFLAASTRIGSEISITGKWVPTNPSGRFRTTAESGEMLQEWEDVHRAAREAPGILSTEINHAVGEDAVLVHHVFADPDATVAYLNSTATNHLPALTAVARPQQHVIRGTAIPDGLRDVVAGTGVPATFGTWRFGFVRDDYAQPDPTRAIQVTAVWRLTDGREDRIDELEAWWQQVGATAHPLEEGLVRFETYRVEGEPALIIHETFADTGELKFHLTKGTADRFKADIDEIAAPDCYYFRGPVSWTIRTYSKFMHLPATYSSRRSHHSVPGGSFSEGLVEPAA